MGGGKGISGKWNHVDKGSVDDRAWGVRERVVVGRVRQDMSGDLEGRAQALQGLVGHPKECSIWKGKGEHERVVSR